MLDSDFVLCSQEVGEITKALVAAQAKMAPADKNSSSQRHKYADFTSIREACRVPLSEQGIALLQFSTEIMGAKFIVTRLQHVSGQFFQCFYRMNVTTNTEHGVGSAMTYAKRYSLSVLLGISTDLDDDGEKAVEEQNASQRLTNQQNEIDRLRKELKDARDLNQAKDKELSSIKKTMNAANKNATQQKKDEAKPIVKDERLMMIETLHQKHKVTRKDFEELLKTNDISVLDENQMDVLRLAFSEIEKNPDNCGEWFPLWKERQEKWAQQQGQLVENANVA